ncbi:MAG: peptidylprolyl isomerase [Prevotellaceae bacterium]|jgi:FKBP-type peptidyl-prolyl cis-trans isomerase SlyD|nr:peptidylprolyl isomerase [Prevotellaceae bacterium]
MQVENNRVVSLSYRLVVDGDIVDQADARSPLQFIFGNGMLLPKFEANVAGKKAGDIFDFKLSAADGYGEVIEGMILEFPHDMFMVDGELEEDLLVEGNVVPMQDHDGHILNGTVVELKDNSVMLDFNHPLAGMDLHFTGKVEDVREATEKELKKGHICGCGDEDCGEHEHDGCGCGCH